jgi:hypothetical protein
MTREQALSELQKSEPEVHLRAIRWLRVIGGSEAVAVLIPDRGCARQEALRIGAGATG